MKKIFTLFSFALFATCALQIQAQTSINDTLSIDGISRNYILYQPAVYDGSSAVPLVINMHGYGSNSVQQLFYGDFKGIADTENFLIVCPNGTLDLSGTRYWNAFVSGGAVDDVSFISQLIDSLSLDYNIDPTQIFATGMSNGGFMSYRLACELTDKIAKIASVTGTMAPISISNCTPSASIPVLQIHGTADPTVPYDGIPNTMAPIEDVVDYWANFNNCDATPNVIAIPDVNTSDNSTAERFEYLNGDNNSSVIFYKVTGGGHTWPGAAIDLPTSGNTNKDFNASQEIWEFFKGEPFVGIKDRLNTNALALYLNQETLTLSFDNLEKINSIRIVNAMGQEVLQTTETQIPVLNLSKGLYYVLVETPSGFVSKAFLK